jgi:sugar O-acyltransferase (sialic acid O-acetyltransferase NeuD family)
LVKLIIIGAGGMASNIVDHMDLEGKVVSYFDTPKCSDEEIYGIPVSLEAKIDVRYCSVVGDPRHKRKLVNMLYNLYELRFSPPSFTNLVQIGSYIAKSVKLGIGVAIQPMTNIYSRVNIGDHVLICGGTRIGHDTEIGDYCTLAPEVAIAGSCRIKDGVFLGINSTLRPDVKIGEGSVVGAGAVCVKDVPPNTVVAGNPAEIIKGLEPW